MLILIGPSASGKTEVAKLLAKKYGITKIITYTTREKRVNERDGIDYHFVSLEDFAKLVADDFFVETTYYNGNYYGTAKKDIADDKAVILDPNGLHTYNALNDSRIISIYIDSKEEVRIKRMRQRLDPEDKIKARILNDRIAFNDNCLKGVTFVVYSENESLDELTDEIYNLYSSIIRL